MPEHPREITWRPKPLNRVLETIVMCAVFVGIAIDSTRQGNLLAEGVAFLFIGVAGLWLFAWRPRLTLTAEAVTVVNPLRTYRLPLSDITEVFSGSPGSSCTVPVASRSPLGRCRR